MVTKNIRNRRSLFSPIKAPSGMTAKILDITSKRKYIRRKIFDIFNFLKVFLSQLIFLSYIICIIQSPPHIPNAIEETAIEKEIEDI
jgi:hypothetical protein